MRRILPLALPIAASVHADGPWRALCSFPRGTSDDSFPVLTAISLLWRD